MREQRATKQPHWQAGRKGGGSQAREAGGQAGQPAQAARNPRRKHEKGNNYTDRQGPKETTGPNGFIVVQDGARESHLA